MEKIEFSTNVEFVEKAKKIMDNPNFKGCYYDNRCMYRNPLNYSERCIVGRMMYGHLCEMDNFWSRNVGAYFESSIYNKFPFLDKEVVSGVQKIHDTRFIDYFKCKSWSEIMEMAYEADRNTSTQTT